MLIFENQLLFSSKTETMNKVFFDCAISLDGFMAGDNRGPKKSIG